MLNPVKIKPGDYFKLSSGDYYIEEEVGSGGFGTVFKAKKKGSYYAIKLNRIWEVLPADRENIKKRIKLEYEISHSIQSEHIVNSFSYDEINENPILVMDYCPGGSLRKRIGNSYSTTEINNIAIQILNGLNILHSFEIIHRDLKPENILFREDLAMLTDFGISAKLSCRLTETNIRGHALRIFATISYSPPEQSQKELAFKLTGPTNDIFSFGVIMYETLTQGILPFGSIEDFQKDTEVIEKRKKKGDWDEDSLKKITGSNYWYSIIKKCLYPEPGDRFQGTNEIIDMLIKVKPKLIGKDTHWKMIVLDGYDKKRVYNLTNLSKYNNSQILTIGRYDESSPFTNDIELREFNSAYISLHHGTLECLIENNIPVWYIRDGQWYTKNDKKGWYVSTNGIKINDKRISKEGTRLNDDDIIQIGKMKLQIFCE